MPIPRRSTVAICLLALAWLATTPTLYAISKCDVFVGYSRLMSDAFYANTGGLNGWEGSMHCKTKPFFGWEGNVSQYGLGAADSVPRTTAVLGGARLTAGTMGVHVWVHGLGGLEHSGNSVGVAISDTKFAYALGAGTDIRILPFFAWRVSGDYLNAAGSNSDGNHARISTGIVIRF
jgi:hypothetical protein